MMQYNGIMWYNVTWYSVIYDATQYNIICSYHMISHCVILYKLWHAMLWYITVCDFVLYEYYVILF